MVSLSDRTVETCDDTCLANIELYNLVGWQPTVSAQSFEFRPTPEPFSTTIPNPRGHSAFFRGPGSGDILALEASPWFEAMGDLTNSRGFTIALWFNLEEFGGQPEVGLFMSDGISISLEPRSDIVEDPEEICSSFWNERCVVGDDDVEQCVTFLDEWCGAGLKITIRTEEGAETYLSKPFPIKRGEWRGARVELDRLRRRLLAEVTLGTNGAMVDVSFEVLNEFNPPIGDFDVGEVTLGRLTSDESILHGYLDDVRLYDFPVLF